jgi:hypothetical protein
LLKRRKIKGGEASFAATNIKMAQYLFLFDLHLNRPEFTFNRTYSAAFAKPQVYFNFLPVFFNAGIRAQKIAAQAPLTKSAVKHGLFSSPAGTA